MKMIIEKCMGRDPPHIGIMQNIIVETALGDRKVYRNFFTGEFVIKLSPNVVIRGKSLNGIFAAIVDLGLI